MVLSAKIEYTLTLSDVESDLLDVGCGMSNVGYELFAEMIVSAGYPNVSIVRGTGDLNETTISFEIDMKTAMSYSNAASQANELSQVIKNALKTYYESKIKNKADHSKKV